jgi:signal transduction histidine kinase
MQPVTDRSIQPVTDRSRVRRNISNNLQNRTPTSVQSTNYAHIIPKIDDTQIYGQAVINENGTIGVITNLPKKLFMNLLSFIVSKNMASLSKSNEAFEEGLQRNRTQRNQTQRIQRPLIQTRRNRTPRKSDKQRFLSNLIQDLKTPPPSVSYAMTTADATTPPPSALLSQESPSVTIADDNDAQPFREEVNKYLRSHNIDTTIENLIRVMKDEELKKKLKKDNNKLYNQYKIVFEYLKFMEK